MNIKELEEKIEEMDAGRGYYALNNPNEISINILEYNKKKHLWEYYFLDERGGIHRYHTFSSEEDACDFVYHDAKATIKIYSDAHAQTEKDVEARE